MSHRLTTTEIGQMLTGMEVQAAVDETIAYIRKTQKFADDAAAHAYWAGQTDDEKVSILRKALET